MKIGIVINPQKPSTRRTAKGIVSILKEKGVEALLSNQDYSKEYRNYIWENAELDAKPDFVIVLGGDGTILQAARMFARDEIPMLGINMGHRGFLADVEVSEIKAAIKALVAGNYQIEKRSMLKAKVFRGNKKLLQSIALNDVVIKAGLARILRLKVFINNDNLGAYPADGIIISSPTGSTAYSLSAGGPIIPPYLNNMLLTPICPLNPAARPILLGAADVVRMEVLSKSDTMLTLDGQQIFPLNKGDIITISEAAMKTRLIRVRSRSFYDLLSEKANVRVG